MRPPRNPHLRAAVEIGFIVFLFYANLLMGEFTATAGRHKTLLMAVLNIITGKNLAIALIASICGHLGFEALRKSS